MLKESLTDTSPVTIKAQSIFGVLGTLALMTVTANVFWHRMRQKKEVETP